MQLPCDQRADYCWAATNHREGENVTLVTADKLAKGLDLTLVGLLSELERRSGEPD